MNARCLLPLLLLLTPLMTRAQRLDTDAANITGVIGTAQVDGNAAALQERAHQEETFYVGIDHLRQRAEDGTWMLEGLLLPELGRYAVDLELFRLDVGTLRIGYDQSRTWYHGHGGYLPITDSWYALEAPELAIDRRLFYVEATLDTDGWPLLTFRYQHRGREGEKSSTSWGDQSNRNNFRRGVLPTVLAVDEVHDTVELDVVKHFGETEVGGGVQGDRIRVSQQKRIRRAPDDPATDRRVTQDDTTESDIFRLHAYTITPLSEWVTLSSAAIYTELSSDVTGDRSYGDSFAVPYDPLYGNRQREDLGYIDLDARGELDHLVLNSSLDIRPAAGWVIVPYVRYERYERRHTAGYLETDVFRNPRNRPVEPAEAFVDAASAEAYDEVAAHLDTRYTGFRRWVLYARAEGRYGEGDLEELIDRREVLPEAGEPRRYLDQETEYVRKRGRVTLGANWYPRPGLSVSAQTWYEVRDYTYDYPLRFVEPDWAYPSYVAWQETATWDANVRVVWRATSWLTATTRVDGKVRRRDGQAVDEAEAVESLQYESWIVSQVVTVAPHPRVLLHLTGSWTEDRLDTPAQELSPPRDQLVLASVHDYVNAAADLFIVLTDASDLQLHYFRYEADNFVDNSAESTPYGVSISEHQVGASYVHRLSPHLRWSLEYGYLDSASATYGGNHDYTAHLLATRLQVRF